MARTMAYDSISIQSYGSIRRRNVSGVSAPIKLSEEAIAHPSSPVERISGLVEELKLSPKQAEKFAPVYLAYQNEIRKIRKDLKTLMDSYKGKEIDEKTAFRMVMDQLNADADIIACKKEYMRVFKAHLTPEQMSKIFLVEKKAMRPNRPDGAPKGRQHDKPAPRE